MRAKSAKEQDEGNPVLLATRVGKDVACEYTCFSLSLSLSLPFSLLLGVQISLSKYWKRPLTQYLRRYFFSVVPGTSKFGGDACCTLSLRKDLEFTSHLDCTFSDLDIIESPFVEITVPCGKNIIVATISLFLDKFNIKIPFYSFENLAECFRLI